MNYFNGFNTENVRQTNEITTKKKIILVCTHLLTYILGAVSMHLFMKLNN